MECHHGVTLRQASALLPLAEAEVLLAKGLRIQHLADYVRMLGVAAETASDRLALVHCLTHQ